MMPNLILSLGGIEERERERESVCVLNKIFALEAISENRHLVRFEIHR